MRNYEGLSAFRLNNLKYSAYSEEKEYLLIEGFMVYVMEVE